jgi:predicted house-cleaning noncanonical NTP pyrophosphatase (MazG superfamily)
VTGEGVLVRDCMQWKIDRVQPYVRKVRSDGELLQLLKKKLLEEVGELLTAPRRTEVLEELADIMQVLRLYANLHRYSMTQVEDRRHSKWTEKGGFGSGVVLAWRQPEQTVGAKATWVAPGHEGETVQQLMQNAQVVLRGPAGSYAQQANLPLDDATVAALNEKLKSGDYPRVQVNMDEVKDGLPVPQAQSLQREPGTAPGASHPEGGGGLGITGRQVPRRGRGDARV